MHLSYLRLATTSKLSSPVTFSTLNRGQRIPTRDEALFSKSVASLKLYSDDDLKRAATARNLLRCLESTTPGGFYGAIILPIHVEPPRPWLALETRMQRQGVNEFQSAFSFRRYPVPNLGRCQLCRNRETRRFKQREINIFLALLFELLPAAVHLAGLPSIKLNQFDLFHAHLFFHEGHIGMLFHSNEYPARSSPDFDIDLGHCQANSTLEWNERKMQLRNIVFWRGRLASIDLGTPLAQELILPGLGYPVYTLLESDFGGYPILGDINYFSWLKGRQLQYKIGVCF